MKKLLALLGLLPLAALAVGPLYFEKSTVPPLSQFYVTAYGAKCNGATNGSDTAGIQAAAAAAAVSGGTVVITGQCSINNTTTLHSNVTVSGYGATLTPVAHASWAGTVNGMSFDVADNTSNVVIQGVNFNYPSDYTGGCHVIQLKATAVSNVLIKDNFSNYCGDFVTDMGADKVIVTNNHISNCRDGCVDIFKGATNTTVTDNIMTVLGTASIGIEFTDTDEFVQPTLTDNVIETGNTIILLGTGEQGINVDLYPTCEVNGATRYITIADNHIFTAAGKQGYGILVRFCSFMTDIHDNTIISDGTDMTAPAIGISTPGTNGLIHHNIVYNWNNQASTVNERGIFRNTSVGGTIENNECYGCTVAAGLDGGLIGNRDTTTRIAGNDTGTGAYTLRNPLTLDLSSASLSKATWGTTGIGLIIPAATYNDTSTGSSSVNNDIAYSFGAPTFTNTQGTANVLSNAITLFAAAPVCGSGWSSCTNLYSISANGRVALNLGLDVAGAGINLNASNNFATNINTGTSAATTTIGNSLSTFTLSAATVNGTSWAVLPAITASSVSTPGQLTSSVVTGTAPLVVASTTNVSNLNASLLNGTTFAAPAAIGSGTPAAGTFTTLTASGATNINASANNATNINTGTSTGTVTIGQNAAAPSSIVLAGPVSFQAGTAYTGASWTTTSPVWNGVAMTLNDTTASGTVATEVARSYQAPNFTSTGGASTTITHAVNLYVAAPTCSGGLVCTNLEAINTPGKLIVTGGAALNGTLNLNASNNAASNIGTGTTNANVSIGNGANLTVLGPTEINTGTKFTLGNFSGCSGTNGTPTTLAGGPQGGSFVTASNGTTCSVVITINGATGKTAATGWACWGSDITSAVVLAQSASSTTTCTLKGTINAVGDTVIFMAMGY